MDQLIFVRPCFPFSFPESGMKVPFINSVWMRMKRPYDSSYDMAMSWFNRPNAIEPQQQWRRRKKNDTPGKSSQKTWTEKKKNSVERKFLLQTFVVLLGSIVTSSLSGVLKNRNFTLHASSLRATLTPSISGILGRRKPEKSIKESRAWNGSQLQQPHRMWIWRVPRHRAQ